MYLFCIFKGSTLIKFELCPKEGNSSLEIKLDTTLEDESEIYHPDKTKTETDEFSLTRKSEQSPGEVTKIICLGRPNANDNKDDSVDLHIPTTSSNSETSPEETNENECHQKASETVLKCEYK